MKKLLLLTSLLIITSGRLYAGWPVGKNHYILSSTLSQYIAKNRWDVYGNFISGNGQSFNATTVGFYGAYGISRKTDVSVSLPVIFQSISYPGLPNTHNASLGDLQVGVSYQLANFKYSNYITLYVGAAAPLYSNTDTRYIGLGNAGGIIRLSNSGSLGEKTFYNVEVGFSQYVGTDPPRQYLGDVTLGYSINRWNQVGIAAGVGRSVSADKRSVSNLLANRDFDYVRASANYGHSFTKRINVNLSFFYTVAGRNTGEGFGGALAFMYKLPFK